MIRGGASFRFMGINLMPYRTPSVPYPPAHLFARFLVEYKEQPQKDKQHSSECCSPGEKERDKQAEQRAQEGEPGVVPVEGRALDCRGE